jgi:drug/metabolite transporter (DMT)-like permease
MNVIFIILLIVTTSFLDTLNQLLLKSSINILNLKVSTLRNILSMILRLALFPRVWLGFCFCTLSLFIWLFVLSKADLNFAFSADSVHYIFIALSSRLILKEKVGFRRWAGTALIIIGITLITWSNR